MAALKFRDQAAKDEVAAAIREIESVTSAEVVVAVRPRSGHYRHVDYLLGFTFAFFALLVFLFDEHEFNIDWMPLDSVIAFGVGAIVSNSIPPLRRALVWPKLMQSNVRTAARASFVDLGVSRTSGRSGILVYVSMFEKRVEVVADIGVDVPGLGPAFADAVASLETALRRRPSFPAFVTALRSFGPPLSKTLPRRADDVNELPDEMST